MLPFSMDGDAAGAGGLVPSSTTASSFLFFTAGVGLIARRRSVKVKQQKQE